MANALESVLAALLGAGQGYLSFDQQRRERAMQDAALQRQQAQDARSAESANLEHVAKLAALRNAGVVPDAARQATTLAMPNPTMPGTVPLAIPQQGRYEPLGGGYSVDTLNTPEARQRIAAAEKQQGETRQQDALLKSYLAAGMPASRARAAILNPSLADDFFKPQLPRDPVMGSPEWKAAKRYEASLRPAPTGADARSLSQALQVQGRFKAEPIIKDADELSQGVQALEQIQAGAPLGAGDLALIIGFNKSLDPGAVVREGDVKLTREAAGVQQRVGAFLANAREGTILPPELRQQLLNVTRKVAAAKVKRARAVRDSYRQQATKNGWDPDLVTIGTDWLAEAPVADAATPGAPATAPSAPAPKYRNNPFPK